MPVHPKPPCLPDKTNNSNCHFVKIGCIKRQMIKAQLHTSYKNKNNLQKQTLKRITQVKNKII